MIGENKNDRKPGHGVRREAIPALADDPILDKLDGPPPEAPKASESSHDKARRLLIAQPGQWMTLNARVKLSETTARRLARSYQRAKPARLVAAASGRFAAQPFVRDDAWLVAAVYQPTPDPPSNSAAAPSAASPPAASASSS